jgi:hypothetical protein
MDTWTGDFAPRPQDWPAVYNEIAGKVTAGILWRKRRLRLAEGAAFHRGLGRAIANQQSIKPPAA